MVVLKLRSFHRWAKSEGITDVALRKAMNEITRGLVDADLGGGLFKKRVARESQGKRDGFRTMLAFRGNNRAIFILGYPKNERDNIGDRELTVLKKLARELLGSTESEIQRRIEAGELIQVN